MRIGGASGIRINIKFEKCQPDNSSTEIARKEKKKKKKKKKRERDSFLLLDHNNKNGLNFPRLIKFIPGLGVKFFFLSSNQELTKLI